MGESGLTAVVVPGHGGKHEELRERVAGARPDLLELVTGLMGLDPFEHLEEGTEYLQPAIYCTSLAGAAGIARDDGPLAFAGHSLGEFAAAAMAGAISEEDGLRIVIERGRLCAEAAREEPGGMLILRADAEQAAALAEQYGLTHANDNAPRQQTLSGPEARIAALEDDCPKLGLTAMRLAVQVPFHSPAMRKAAEGLAAALADVPTEPPEHLLLSGATAAPFVDLPRELAEALIKPVRWRETVLELERRGARSFIDSGPGRILARLVSQIVRDVPVASADELG